jgi:hypothetical protein
VCRSHQGDEVPREQVVDLALLVAFDYGGERAGQPMVYVTEVSFRIAYA